MVETLSRLLIYSHEKLTKQKFIQETPIMVSLVDSPVKAEMEFQTFQNQTGEFSKGVDSELIKTSTSLQGILQQVMFNHIIQEIPLTELSMEDQSRKRRKVIQEFLERLTRINISPRTRAILFQNKSQRVVDNYPEIIPMPEFIRLLQK